jgi:hypothetical protein
MTLLFVVRARRLRQKQERQHGCGGREEKPDDARHAPRQERQRGVRHGHPRRIDEIEDGVPGPRRPVEPERGTGRAEDGVVVEPGIAAKKELRGQVRRGEVEPLLRMEERAPGLERGLGRDGRRQNEGGAAATRIRHPGPCSRS